ncbi:MAG: phytoene desaturase family protein [Aggregatilineales bacterium]
MSDKRKIIVIGAGIGGLTAAALLSRAEYSVSVFETQAYAGGCAGTFAHKGYRFDAGATVAGGFQPGGPHAVVGDMLDIKWPVRRHDPAWVVHLPDIKVALTQDNSDVTASFPQSQAFWNEQAAVAALGWKLASTAMPWPPGSAGDVLRLARVGLAHFPEDMRLIPYVFSTVRQWAARLGLERDTAFNRFLDAQLLISAQTTAERVNAVWGATALDLARQGVYHVAGGMGGLADTLVDCVRASGGEVLYRRPVSRIVVESGRAIGVYVTEGRRGAAETFFPADFIVANLTPWSLDTLLGVSSPPRLRREATARQLGWGAFVLHLGVKADMLPDDLPDHHQIVDSLDGPLGETHSVFVSISPKWDTSRAPQGYRAVTVTTHTAVQPWWDALQRDSESYQARKTEYAAKMLDSIERALPGFRNAISLMLPGTPLTYNYYTGRHLGMVGGFPVTSLFGVRGPRTGIANLRLVGDSIFPGQSTAGVTLGALRVSREVQRILPAKRARLLAIAPMTGSTRP